MPAVGDEADSLAIAFLFIIQLNLIQLIRYIISAHGIIEGRRNWGCGRRQRESRRRVKWPRLDLSIPVTCYTSYTSTPQLHYSVSMRDKCNIYIVQMGYCKITDLAEIHTLTPTHWIQSAQSPSPEQ